MTHDLIALGVLATAYFGGRARQWWLSRQTRKTAGAVEHLARKFNEKGDKQ